MVARERLRLSRVLALWGGGVTVAAVASVLAIAALWLGSGRWMTLPRIIPFLPWVLAIGGVVAVTVLTRRLLVRDASTTTVASAIERERRLRAGTVRGAIEVSHTGVLGRRGAKAVANRLTAMVSSSGAALAPLLRRAALHRATISATIAGVALATLGAAAVTQPDGWSAVLHPIRAWRGTLLPALQLAAPADVPRGQEAHIRVTAPGRSRVAIYMRATGSGWTSAWYPTPGGRADITTSPVAATVAIVATDGRATSDTAIVRASDRPFVGSVALRALYPAYLHRTDETLPAGEVARVPRGTRIDIAGEASTELTAVDLVRGRDTVSLVPAGRRFAGRLVAEVSGQWAWRAAGPSGATIDVPAAIDLQVVPDSAPHVQIVNPARDTVVTASDHIPVVISASDDHALASVVLRSWRTQAGVDLMPVVQPVSDSAVGQWSGEVTLDLAARGLQPGDALHVVAEATDGSPWHQMTQSRILVLRVPSIAEERVLARSAADSAASAASATASAQRQLEQRTEEAARARGSRTGATTGSNSSPAPRSTLSYESAQQAKALAKEQRELAGRVEQLQRQTQQLERQLKQAGALDSGLASQLREAQQLLSTALTPELREQLSHLDQSADSLRGGDTRQSLADLAQQQQQLREQLDRSVDVLKRAALEGAMATLRDEAKDIAKQERASAAANPSAASTPNPSAGTKQQLADNGRPPQSTPPSASAGATDSARRANAGKADQTGANQQSAAQQPGAQPPGQSPQQPAGGRQSSEQLAQRSQELSKDVQQLAQRLAAEKAQTGAQKVGAARSNVDSSTQAMNQRNTNTAATQMSQAADQLGDARKAQIEEWKQKLTSDLDKSIQETMQAARQESELAQKVQEGKDKKEVQEQQSAVQQGAERTGQRMQQASQQSGLVSGNSQRALGQARSQVQAATREAEQSSSGAPSGQQTANAMKAAADALNQAAAAMAHDRERAGSASSASGLAEMMQEMQQLAKAQGAINSQAQGLSMTPGSTAPGSGQNPGARAVAEGQRKLAESLDRMGDDDATGKSQALASEAHQIADALSRSGMDPQTLIRQQRLYHRLLDAGHTLEQDERDSTGKRVAQAATGREQFTPDSTPVSGNAVLRFGEPSWSELRDLSADERQIVLEYFKRINAQATQTPPTH